MNQSLISVRYAKALFKLAKEKDLLDIIHKDLEILTTALSESDDFKSFIESPVQSNRKKKEIFVLLYKKAFHIYSMQFLDLIIDKSREKYLLSIIRNYDDFYRSEKEIKKVSFTSAVEIAKESIASVKSTIEKALNSSVELTVKTDEKLIGGFVITVDGKLMDASIAHKLTKIKKQLLN